MLKKLILIALVIISSTSFFACKKCQTIILCPSKNEVYYKIVGSDTFSLYVPNCFTPNADGTNDNFQIFGKNIATVNVKVYDGLNLVATLNSFNDKWDGKVSGDVHAKVYTLFVNAGTNKGENISFNGTLSSAVGYIIYDTKVIVYEHLLAKTENIQTAAQWDNVTFNPSFPNSEYFNKEINKCGI